MLASELIIQNKSCRYSNHEFKSLPSEDSGLMVAVNCLNKHSCLNIHIAQFHIIYFPHVIKFSLPNFPILQNSHIIRLTVNERAVRFCPNGALLDNLALKVVPLKDQNHPKVTW